MEKKRIEEKIQSKSNQKPQATKKTLKSNLEQ